VGRGPKGSEVGVEQWLRRRPGITDVRFVGDEGEGPPDFRARFHRCYVSSATARAGVGVNACDAAGPVPVGGAAARHARSGYALPARGDGGIGAWRRSTRAAVEWHGSAGWQQLSQWWPKHVIPDTHLSFCDVSAKSDPHTKFLTLPRSFPTPQRHRSTLPRRPTRSLP